LIINADDFGLHPGINAGIIAGFKKGIITSASISVNGKAYQDAVLLLKQNPGLDIGLHVTLIEEYPVLGAEKVKSLCKQNKFYSKSLDFLSRYFLGLINMNEIEIEVAAQINEALKSGLKLTHIDSHRHLHLLPGIGDFILKIANKYNIKYVRSGRFKPALKMKKRLWELKALDFLGRRLRNRAGNSHLKSSEMIFGFQWSGGLTKSLLIEIVDSTETGVAELICHPGLNNRHISSAYPQWEYNWEGELNALLSSEFKQAIEDNDIKLVNFQNLDEEQPGV